MSRYNEQVRDITPLFEQLRQCLSELDSLELYQAAAHVDMALHLMVDPKLLQAAERAQAGPAATGDDEVIVHPDTEYLRRIH